MAYMAELRVILGIGNPGKQYEGTRHNIGFDVIDVLAERYAVRLSEKKWHAHYAEVLIPGAASKLLLVKPQTYVNESGKTLQAIMTFYKLPAEACMVVVDDLNLKFGDLRLRAQGSAGGHNGLRDMERLIGQKYPRLRIGIGAPTGNQVNYVLGKFKPEEQADLNKLLQKSADCCETWLRKDFDAAMSFNGPLNPPPPKPKKPRTPKKNLAPQASSNGESTTTDIDTDTE